MATIKDIARLAGVAQGTVSNVLNGKGNVSSEKIKCVLDAAHTLGYVPNERAALLRRGRSDSLAVIMPESRARQYEDFYQSFKDYASRHGYKVIRQRTNENSPETEEEAWNEVRSLNVKGTACISIIAGTAMEDIIYNSEFMQHNSPNLLFIDRRPRFEAAFIGFDYKTAGKAMAQKAISKKYKNVCLVTGNLKFVNESDFYQNFMNTIEKTGCQVTHIQTDSFRKYQNIMEIFNVPMPQAFFISNYGFAESVKDLCQTFYGPENPPKIFTISPVFTMPENDFCKYEMNYSQLGKIAAETLIKNSGKKDREKEYMCRYVESNGFRDWYANISVSNSRRPINVITLNSPEAYIMRSFSKLYTKKTGIDVNVCIFSYDEIYETFNTLNSSSHFDVLRLDVTWLSWFAEKLLRPLTDIDPDIEQLFSQFVPGISDRYSKVNGIIYALPSTPSAMVLFYRKDLFENSVYKRMFWERFKEELTPPETFRDFNRIASFFTRAYNSDSPTDYGSTITMGSTGVAGSEYLARLFSYQENLYDQKNRIRFDSAISVRALKDMMELKQYTSKDYCFWWIDTADRFAEGNYAMAPLYTNYASSLLNPSSKVLGKIGYTIMPGSNPIIGGGSLGVSKNSSHPEDALSFIKWMCSDPISSGAAFLGSTSPCQTTYDNYEVIYNFPWLNLSQKCFALARGKRIPDSFAIPFDERKFLSIIGTAAKNAYSNVATPEEALKSAQEQFEKYFPFQF